VALFLVALAIHIFSSLVWIGSMFFGYTALKPDAAFHPEQRLLLWRRVFSIFLSLSVGSIIVMWVSSIGVSVLSGSGPGSVSWHSIILLGLVTIMTITTLGVIVGPYQSYLRHVEDSNLDDAAATVQTMRKVMLGNTVFGIIVVIVASLPNLSAFPGIA